jgi:hypothetical protein
MNRHEKIVDFLSNFIILTIGGMVYAVVEKANLNAVLVLSISGTIIGISVAIVFMLFRVDKKISIKKE